MNPLSFQDLHNVHTSSSQVRMFLVEHPATSLQQVLTSVGKFSGLSKRVKHKCLGSRELDPNHETNLSVDLEL